MTLIINELINTRSCLLRIQFPLPFKPRVCVVQL